MDKTLREILKKTRKVSAKSDFAKGEFTFVKVFFFYKNFFF